MRQSLLPLPRSSKPQGTATKWEEAQKPGSSVETPLPVRVSALPGSCGADLSPENSLEPVKGSWGCDADGHHPHDLTGDISSGMPGSFRTTKGNISTADHFTTKKNETDLTFTGRCVPSCSNAVSTAPAVAVLPRAHPRSCGKIWKLRHGEASYSLLAGPTARGRQWFRPTPACSSPLLRPPLCRGQWPQKGARVPTFHGKGPSAPTTDNSCSTDV